MFEKSVVARVKPQRYGTAPRIDGVQRIPLKRFVDEGGSLLELGRLAEGALEGVPDFHLAQLTFCEVEPGAIKAWHVHREQDDLWFVPPGHRLLGGLWDVREGSRTRGTQLRVPLGAGQAELVHIPHGVAHGVANHGSTTAHMIYLLNRTFQTDPTDELRLPWDAAGADFWNPRHG